jgi:hypothetical protein
MPISTLRSGLPALVLGLTLGLVLGAMPMRAPATDTHACGQRVVSVGESIASLRAKCGEPDRIVQLVNVFGAGTGQRWEYDRRNATVLFTVSGGRVTAIDEVR